MVLVYAAETTSKTSSGGVHWQALANACMAKEARKRPTFREIEDDLNDLRLELDLN